MLAAAQNQALNSIVSLFSSVGDDVGGLGEFLRASHSRTAIGFNARYLYLVAVDGRQKELSAGISLVELAALMKQIGCREALNLDGGGSTTFWLNGKVMNSPSDKHERAIANALVIVKKSKRRNALFAVHH